MLMRTAPAKNCCIKTLDELIHQRYCKGQPRLLDAASVLKGRNVGSVAVEVTLTVGFVSIMHSKLTIWKQL